VPVDASAPGTSSMMIQDQSSGPWTADTSAGQIVPHADNMEVLTADPPAAPGPAALNSLEDTSISGHPHPRSDTSEFKEPDPIGSPDHKRVRTASQSIGSGT